VNPATVILAYYLLGPRRREILELAWHRTDLRRGLMRLRDKDMTPLRPVLDKPRRHVQDAIVAPLMHLKQIQTVSAMVRNGVGSLFSRPLGSTAGAQRGFHPKAHRHSPHPTFFAKWSAALDTEPEGFQLRTGLRPIHPRRSIARPFHRPITKPGHQLGLRLNPSPEA
jgi:hypothetical protein